MGLGGSSGYGRGMTREPSGGQHSAPRKDEGSYLSLIEGVRGLAAMAILFYHYVHFFMPGPSRQAPPGAQDAHPAHEQFWLLYDHGYLAVQAFWLISGFVFSHVYHGHSASTRSFFVNRLARLYPLHILTLAVVCLLQWIALQRLGYTPIYGKFDPAHFIPHLFLASAWWTEGGGYSFNGPVWSVSAEVVIYALFWQVRGLVARGGLPLVLALAFGFYGAHHYLGDYSKVFACGFYFFAGSGFSLLWQARSGSGRPLRFIVAAFAAIGLGAGLEGSDWALRYLALPASCGALFLLLAAAEGRAPRGLRRVCQWLGENTYGVYLWHFPLQLCAMLLMMPSVHPGEIASNGWFLAAYLVVVASVARVSFVWFERPLRDGIRRRFAGGRQAGKVGAP